MKLRLPKQLCIALSAIALATASQQTFADTTVHSGETLTVGSGNASDQHGVITVENGANILLNDGATVDAQFTYGAAAKISLEVAENATATWNAAAQPTTAGTGVSSVSVGAGATLTLGSTNDQYCALNRDDVPLNITLEQNSTLITNKALFSWNRWDAQTDPRVLLMKEGSTWKVNSTEWLNKSQIQLSGGTIVLGANMDFERKLSTFEVLSTATAMSKITAAQTGTQGKLLLGGGDSSASSLNGKTGDLFTVNRGAFNFDNTNTADLRIDAIIADAGSNAHKLLKAGEGLLQLTGANTYTKGTYIHAGTILASSASALGTGTVEINQGALLQFSTTDAVSNDLSGAGRVEFTKNARYSGNASQFTGTFALKRDSSDHNGHINISDTYTGNFEVQGRFDIHDAVFGGAQKVILNTDGVSNTTGFWSHDGATTLAKALEITGSNTAELFLSSDVTLNANLTASAGSTLKISNGGTLQLNGAENTIGSLNINSGNVQVSETATLTFVNTLNGGSLNLTKVIGTGTIALTEQHGINSASAATITLDSNFTGALNYQGSINYNSNLGGASKVVFGGTSNILYADSTPNQLQEFSKNIELANGATLGLTSWGSASRTAVNLVSGSIKGGSDTIIRKTDGGAITLTGDLSGFHGTFEMNAGNYGFVIDVAEGATNSTDAAFTGGLELRKTGAGNLTLSGSIQSNVKNLGDGSLILTGTLAAGKEIRNESTNGKLVLDNATLGSGNGRLNIKGGTITFRTGITDNTTEGNKYAVTVEGDGTADFTDGTFDFSSKNLAAWDGSTIKANSGSTLKVGALFWSPGENYGNVAVEQGGKLIVGAGTSPVVNNGQSGKVRVKNFTNKGESALHGFTNINNVSNEGTLSLLGTESKTFGAFTQSGADAKLLLGEGLTLETSKANGGSIEGSYDVGANATLNLKQLGAEVTASLKDLTLAQNAVMGVYTDNTTNATAEGNISVSGTLKAGSGAKLNANLTVNGGATIDVDHTTGGLHMGSTLTFAGGEKMHVSDNIIAGLNSLSADLAFGGSVTLFSGVDAFSIGDSAYDAGTTYKASDYFDLAGVNRPWDFVIKFEADAATDGGTVSLYMETPEPATATLSLLALAALAAKRKRK